MYKTKGGFRACSKEKRGPNWVINAKHIAIVSVLEGLMRKYGKAYSYPSQEKIIELLQTYHGFKMTRRTLNRYLADIERWNCIGRIVRHHEGPNRTMQFRTTAYYILQRVAEIVKKFLRQAIRLAEVFRVPRITQYSLTTERDLNKSYASDGDPVPLDWIKDFRKQLSAA